MMLLLSTAPSKFTSKCKMGDFTVLEEHLKKLVLCEVFFTSLLCESSCRNQFPNAKMGVLFSPVVL
jgi:hypothetical protein